MQMAKHYCSIKIESKSKLQAMSQMFNSNNKSKDMAPKKHWCVKGIKDINAQGYEI